MKGKYTVKIGRNKLTLKGLQGGTETITKDNKHYSKMLKAGKEQRIVNFTDTGRVTICADYTGA